MNEKIKVRSIKNYLINYSRIIRTFLKESNNLKKKKSKIFIDFFLKHLEFSFKI